MTDPELYRTAGYLAEVHPDVADDPVEERRDGVSGHARAVPGLPSAAVLREQLTELVAADVFQRADAAGETVCAGSVRRRPEEFRAHPPGCPAAAPAARRVRDDDVYRVASAWRRQVTCDAGARTALIDTGTRRGKTTA